jgi:TPR repeat protein
MYEYGEGVEMDFVEAANLYQKAAEQGHPGAQHCLSALYAEGKGVEQDYGAAEQWAREAAENGNADAQLNLSTMYYHGQGRSPDKVMAYMWLSIAIACGNTEAAQYRETHVRDIHFWNVWKAERLAREWLDNHGAAK